jgi:hypothetical protein
MMGVTDVDVKIWHSTKAVTLASQVEYLLSIAEDFMKEALTIYDALDTVL